MNNIDKPENGDPILLKGSLYLPHQVEPCCSISFQGHQCPAESADEPNNIRKDI